MSSVRAVGNGMPNLLRINGQEITTQPSAPVEGPRPAVGPATEKPVAPPPDPSVLQEEAFDLANQTSLRGEEAAAMLHGKKPIKKRDVTKKKTQPGRAAEGHKRVDGIFAEDDPANRQEGAFQAAAEFEEEAKEIDMKFARKAAQVEVGSQVFQADLDNGSGALVMGEAREIDLPAFQLDDGPSEEVTAIRNRPVAPPAVSVQSAASASGAAAQGAGEMPRDETVPNFEVPTSETGLRRILGLGKK